ncbi:GNAT family N-acetyltransferase [Paenibacillus elgii]
MGSWCPSFRNKGIASSILSFLKQEAARAGFRSLLLETGPMQPESIALYKKFGFIDIDPFGEYVEHPRNNLKTLVLHFVRAGVFCLELPAVQHFNRTSRLGD